MRVEREMQGRNFNYLAKEKGEREKRGEKVKMASSHVFKASAERGG